MTGAALATVAIGSGVQVALYLRHFGVSHRTDGFIAAFAVYSLIVVVAQILRTTAVPLLTGAPARLNATAFAWALVAIAMLTLVAGLLLAAALADVVAASTGRAGRAVATASLRVMAPAAALQLLGAGLAVRGAVHDRMIGVSAAYMASAGAGLAAFLPLRAAAAERALAWTTLVASVVLVLGLLIGAGRPVWERPRLRALPGATLSMARSVSVPASFVVMYPITLALGPRARAGDVTLFGLAFTACSYLSGFTGQGLSMVDAVALARLPASAVAQRSAFVSRAFFYSLLVAAPGFGCATLMGAPIVRGLISSHPATTSFAAELLLLAPWTVATLGLWASLPAVLSHLTPSAERRLLGGVVGLIVIHVSATLAARGLAGFDGVVVAMVVAPAVFVLGVLVLVVRGAAAALARSLVLVSAAAGASYGGLFLVCRLVLGSGVASGLAASVGGSVLYAALAAVLFPDAAKTIRGLLGCSPRAAR